MRQLWHGSPRISKIEEEFEFIVFSDHVTDLQEQFRIPEVRESARAKSPLPIALALILT